MSGSSETAEFKVVFRDLRGGAHAANDHEILIKHVDSDRVDHRDLADQVYAKGVGVLLRGSGDPERLVVSEDPTLDDMLAVAYLKHLLVGRALPPAAESFARYAALVREGLRPGEMPSHDSLEGLFLAVRSDTEMPLTEPRNAAQFLERWALLEREILEAATAGRDPFKERLFVDGPVFARERAFLTRDYDVYTQDVLRGERWLIRLPGGPKEASGLMLQQPKAALFKHWCRQDDAAPAGGTYLFLAVDRGGGNWILSTDPVQRLSLKPLAERLQMAELEKSGEAAEDPWFDGAPFHHTLVAAPRRGSRLSHQEVIREVKDWLGAKVVRARSTARSGSSIAFPVAISSAVVIAALIAALLLLGRRDITVRVERERSDDWKPVDYSKIGAMLTDDQKRDLILKERAIQNYALLVCVKLSSYLPKLDTPCSDVAQVYALLLDHYGYARENIVVLADDDTEMKKGGIQTKIPTRSNVIAAIQTIGEKSITKVYERSSFLFFYAGHGDRQKHAKTVGYLVLTDCNEKAIDKKVEPLDQVCLDMERLVELVRKHIASDHKLLLLDSCFSGFATRVLGNPPNRPGDVYQTWQEPSLEIIVAAQENQKAGDKEDGEKGRSYFAGALLDGLGEVKDGYHLADLKKDHIITAAELGAHVRNSVRKRQRRTQARGKPLQDPQHYRGVKGDGLGQFLFVPVKGAPPPK